MTCAHSWRRSNRRQRTVRPACRVLRFAVAHREMERKREIEGTSLADRAFCPDPSTMRLHDALGDVEAESDASSIVPGDLKGPLEHRVQLIGGNPRTRVADSEA